MNFPALAAESILPALRAATGKSHERLEAVADIEHRIAHLPAYTALLKKMLGFYRPLERRLTDHGNLSEFDLDYSIRLKSPWLHSDLRALGLSTEEITTLPDCTRLPELDPANVFGSLYVVEGATLGGRQISALMRHSPVPTNARAFFSSYGAETGVRWKEFIAALEAHAAAGSDEDRERIVEAAVETFDCLEAWLGERPQFRE